jgi:putative NADH-flavin reductase
MSASVPALMKVLVLGASGRLGRVLLARATSANLTVTAFTRHPGPLLTGDPSIRIFGGSVHDIRAVQRAMQKQDAVIWAVAQRDGSTLPLLHGTRVIIQAMIAMGVRRFIYVSDALLYERDESGPATRLLHSLFGHSARREARDREQAVRESALDWTLVRPARLTAGPHVGRSAVVMDVPPRPSPIARTDVAAFIITQLAERTFVHQAPYLVAVSPQNGHQAGYRQRANPQDVQVHPGTA